MLFINNSSHREPGLYRCCHFCENSIIGPGLITFTLRIQDFTLGGEVKGSGDGSPLVRFSNKVPLGCLGDDEVSQKPITAFCEEQFCKKIFLRKQIQKVFP